MNRLDLLLIRSNDVKTIYGSVAELTACEPPWWAAMIAAYVREHAIRVEILDAEAENISSEQVANITKTKNPIIVGIIVTGTNLSASTWKMKGAGSLARQIKNIANIPIFLWGLHPAALPERTLKDEQVDYVIKGEGLATILELIKRMKSGNLEFQDLKGLFYKTNNGINGNHEISLIKDISSLPMPAYDLLPMSKYVAHNWHRFGEMNKSNRENKGYAVISTSLGCPFSCSFCAISALFGQKKVRYQTSVNVVNEIDLLVKKYKVHFIKILDECFVLNRKHVEQICDLLIERGYDLNIWAYARVDTVDVKLLDKLRRAGVKWLALGIESINKSAMEGVQKGQYTKSQIMDVVKMIKQADINVGANFMFGLPEDNIESMAETLTFARELNCEWVNFYTTMAYPGSQLYFDQFKNSNVLPEDWTGYSQFSYDCKPLSTKYLTSKEVLAFRDYAFPAFFENNDRYYSLIKEKFGEDAVAAINSMLGKKLSRKLLKD